MVNLPVLLKMQPEENRWWIPVPPPEDEEEGDIGATHMRSFALSLLMLSEYPDTITPPSGSTELRRSGRESKGKAPARDDTDAWQTSGGGGDVPMDEGEDGEETPRRPRAAKRAIESPRTEGDAPPTRRQRTTNENEVGAILYGGFRQWLTISTGLLWPLQEG